MSTYLRQLSQSTSHHSTHTGFHTRKHLILTSLGNNDGNDSGSSSSSNTNTGAKSDKSPKGSIDELMLPLINLLNKHNDYVTTSSCSGRIAVYCVGNGLSNNNSSKSNDI